MGWIHKQYCRSLWITEKWQRLYRCEMWLVSNGGQHVERLPSLSSSPAAPSSYTLSRRTKSSHIFFCTCIRSQCNNDTAAMNGDKTDLLDLKQKVKLIISTLGALRRPMTVMVWPIITIPSQSHSIPFIHKASLPELRWIKMN